MTLGALDQEQPDALAEAGLDYYNHNKASTSPHRPPPVPVGTSHLHITFSAAHSDAHLDRLIKALERVRMHV